METEIQALRRRDAWKVVGESKARVTVGRTAAELQRIMKESPQICPVCRFVTRGIKEHIDTLFYERVTDVPTREAIREAGGFCRHHARLVAEQGDALGTALIYKDVLTNELRAFDGGRFDRPPNAASGPFARFFDAGSGGSITRAPCPICEGERDMAALAVDGLLDAIPDPEFAAVFSQATGLCLPHFQLAFGRARNGDSWKVVLEHERRVLQGLVDDLGELARKYDYRHKAEPFGTEANSWRRALNTTAGWPDE